MTDAPLIGTDAFRSHAEDIATGRLLRARGLLAVVDPDVRLAIEQAAYALAADVAEFLLQEAAGNRVLEATLVGNGASRTRIDDLLGAIR